MAKDACSNSRTFVEHLLSRFFTVENLSLLPLSRQSSVVFGEFLMYINKMKLFTEYFNIFAQTAKSGYFMSKPTSNS